ncbi:efflux RND transporter periplasmic adaptor subunit [Pleionea sp. CnH1-48]|uniref:efflux RND transporter periplasmic adaptor subunit n=1 Tax=Pleionea sp. CnH1-48 TaxID=2954494 RepID=UPI0020986231|nr:efflux RND transporter periplasmic adaptor subunit [Pleionea sp. CnH1-48]MCO7225235.1 efflux RND transporter periplasmic adaptor subunit [Pleionea sp. CnH1-48]
MIARYPLILITTILLLPLTGCDSPQQAAQQEVIRPAKITQVTDASEQLIRTFPAQVEANVGSNLAFRVSGELQNFVVKAGQEVKQGQLLAKLDPEDFQLQLDDRTARHQLAISQFQRAEALVSKNLSSQSNYDEAKANLLIAESNLKKAETDLAYTELRAPYNGTISKVYIKNHENIQAKQNILRIQSREIIDVSIQLPERLVAHIKKGTGYKPTVRFDAFPEKSYEIKVKEWDTQADAATLTYKVVFSLPVPEGFNVFPGMTAKVYMDLSKITDFGQNLFTLPVDAVFSPEDIQLQSDERFVWKFDPETQTVSRLKVKVGEIHSEGIEILEGLNSGDEIVTAGVHYLSEGMKIRPWSRERGL